MAASPTKSKGGGTILIVLVLLLGVAGASAWFIRGILNGKDAPAATTGTAASAADERGEPATLPTTTVGASGASDSDGAPGSASADVPPGQFVAPPANIPVATADAGQSGGLPGSAPDGLPPAMSAVGAERDADLPDTPAPNLLMAPGTTAQTPLPAGEDAVVRPAFVNDIAAFLAQNYWPKNTHPSARRSGITTASLHWANLRYGAELRGSDPSLTRRAILGYILNPTAVGRIYGLYADGFASALRQEADRRLVGEGDGKRPLSTAEKKEMFGIYSGYAARTGSALERYATDPAMPDRVQAYAEAEQAAHNANRVYMESVMAHEEAAESGNKPQVTAARLRMDKEAATYQKRIREREGARNALVRAMSRDNKVSGSDDTLVYAAFWAYRRGPESSPALRSCAKALGDMSAKLAAESKQIQ